jgi:hypothetical protein
MDSIKIKVMIYLWLNISILCDDYQGYILIQTGLRHCRIIANIKLYYGRRGHNNIN